MTDQKNSEAVDYDRVVAQETLLFEAAERVAELINEAGISRTELADRLGKSKGFVTQVLAGDRNMTLRTLADLGYFLGHSFDIVAKRSTTASGDLAAGATTQTVVAHPGHECPSPARRWAGYGAEHALSQLPFRRLCVGCTPDELPLHAYTRISA